MNKKILMMSALVASASVSASQADQLVYWNFGPNAPGYTEIPTVDNLDSPSSILLNGGIQDTNGKDGVPYTDAEGVHHAEGQGGAWDNIAANANWTIRLDTTGWQDLNLRWDHKSWPGSARLYNLQYRVGAGAWANIATSRPIVDDRIFREQSFNLSNFAAIENQPSVELRVVYLNESERFAFDNVEVTGDSSGLRPIISLVVDGIAESPFLSGVVGDATDPLSTGGVNFTLSHEDPSFPVENLIIGYESNNPSVVVNPDLILSGTGANRNLKITPIGRGFATITLTVSDGQTSVDFDLIYAAALNGQVPADFVYGVGVSDASTSIALSDGYMLVANDEGGIGLDGPDGSPGPQIYLYDALNSGLPIKSFDFSAQLAPTSNREFDIEASTRIGNRVFWLTSHGNNRNGEDRPNRRRLFATDILNVGEDTELVYVDHYENLRDRLILWDSAGWHGKGGAYYDFSEGAGHRVPKHPFGFNIEGLALGPDGSTAYIGFRAPVVWHPSGDRALIVPIKNFQTWFESGQELTQIDFADPIELDLDGRSIRSIDSNGKGEYLIVAGSWGDIEDTGIEFALYRWSGDPSDTKPIKLRDLLDPVPRPIPFEGNIQPGSYEGIVDVPTPIAGSDVPLVIDNGRSFWYQTGQLESKDLPRGYQRFASEKVSLPTRETQIGLASGGVGSGLAVARSGNIYAVRHVGYPTNSNVLVSYNRDLTERWSVPLDDATFSGSSPVIGDGEVIYVGVRGHFYAISSRGDVLWAFPVGDESIESDPAIGADGTIYVGVDWNDARVYAINPDGTQKWMATTSGDCIRSITTGPDDQIYVANCEDRTLYAFHTDGSLLWSATTPPGSDEMYEMAVAADNTIYVGDDGAGLHAFDGNTGILKWTFPRQSGNGVEGVPAIGEDGTVYAAERDGVVYALTPAGTQVWQVALSSRNEEGISLGPDGNLYLSSGPNFYVLDAEDGSVLWSQPLSLGGSLPVISNDGSIYLHSGAGTIGLVGEWGWTENALVRAMSGYAASSWPTAGQNPFGTSQVPARGLNPLAENVMREVLPANATIYTDNDFEWAIGYHFTPKVDGQITSLGGYYEGTKTIKVFHRASGQLLTQKRVHSSNSWSYLDVEPVDVSAGQQYTVAVYLEGSGGSFSTGPVPIDSEYVTMDEGAYVFTANEPDAIPVDGDTVNNYYGLVDIGFTPLGSGIWSEESPGNDAEGGAWHYAMGYHFTALEEGWVTALGGNFEGTKKVRLFDRATGRRLAETTVAANNSFRYTNIVPVEIESGRQYTVAVYLEGSGGTFSPAASVAFPITTPSIRIDSGTFAFTAGNPEAVPTNTYSTRMLGQPDIKFLPKQ